MNFDTTRATKDPAPMSTNDRQGIHIVAETKLMQQYRIARDVLGGTEVVSIWRADGSIEIFVVAADGKVWNIHPDSKSSTGTSVVCTPLVARNIAVGTLNTGKIVVLGIDARNINYIIEAPEEASNRWSWPQTATMTLPPDATAVSRIYTDNIGGKLYVGALIALRNGAGGLGSTQYAFMYSLWDFSPHPFTSTSFVVSSLQCCWWGPNAQLAEFRCADIMLARYRVASGTITVNAISIRPHIFRDNFNDDPFALTSRSVTTVEDYSEVDHLFAVLGDGNVYELTGGYQGVSFEWTPVTQGMHFQRITGGLDGRGHENLFVLGAQNALWHLQRDWYKLLRFTDPVILQQNVRTMSMTAPGYGAEIGLFSIGLPPNASAASPLLQTMLQRDSGNWLTMPVHVPNAGDVQEYIAYATDLLVLHDERIPMPHTNVEVRATGIMIVTINGSTYCIDPEHPVMLRTSATGALSIVQETNALSTPSLLIAFPDRVTDVVWQLDPFAGVQARLDGITASDLENATIADGSYLLPPEYRTKRTCGSLARTCNQAISYVTEGTGSIAGVHVSDGWSWKKNGDIANAQRIHLDPDKPRSHWHFGTIDGELTHRSLTQDEARAEIAQWRSKYTSINDLKQRQSRFGLSQYFAHLGDFCLAAKQRFLQVFDTIITEVDGKVHAVFHFEIDNNYGICETVLEVIGDAFHLIEIIFTQAKTYFSELVEWLGFVFAWNDILRTHEVIRYLVGQAFDIVPHVIDQRVKPFIHDKLTHAKEFTDAHIEACKQWLRDLDISSLAPLKPGDRSQYSLLSSAASNNIVFNAMVENHAESTFPSLPNLDTTTDFIQHIIDVTNRLLSSNEAQNAKFNLIEVVRGRHDRAWSETVAEFVRILALVMAELLEVAIDEGFALLSTLVDKALDFISSSWSAFRSLLCDPCTIPFVSELYQKLTRTSLSAISAISLMLAIPATAGHKAVVGSAPFPDNASVAQFKATYNADAFIEWFFPTHQSIARSAETSSSLVGAGRTWLALASSAALYYYGQVSGVLDLFPNLPNTPTVTGTYQFSVASFSLETISQILCCPWFYLNDGSSPMSEDASAATILWIIEWFGITIDAVFLCASNAIAENSNSDIGVAGAVLYGVIHSGTLGLLLLADRKLTPLALQSKIGMIVPELSKMIKLSSIEEETIPATEGLILAVVPALDLLGYSYASGQAFRDYLVSASIQTKVDGVTVPGSEAIVAQPISS